MAAIRLKRGRMHTRRDFFGISALLGTAISGIAQERPRVVYPKGVIELPFPPNTHLRQIVARPEGIYALGNTRNGSEVIHVDFVGRVINRRPLQPKTQQILIVGDGEIVALRFQGGSSIISGHTLTEKARVESIYSIAFLNSKVVGISKATLDTDLSQDVAPAISLPNDNLLVAGLPDGSLALVAKQEQVLWRVDTGLRIGSGIQLIAPELRSISRARQNDGSSIYEMCSDQNSDLYCLATPYNGAEGARLLRLGINGAVKDRLFLVMPEFEETRQVGDGRLLAARMAVHSSSVFVGSGTSKTTRLAFFTIA